MKNLAIILLLAITLSSLPASAYVGFGICNYGKEKISSIICYGPAVLNETTVSGDVKVAGPLKAYRSSMETVTIAGSAEIWNSIINGVASVTGYLNANYVIFAKDLKLTTTKSELNHSNVKGSIMINSSIDKPYLVLKCTSKVEGSITFSGIAGVVQITDDSKIEGKVKNGEMEFVKKPCK